MHYWLHLRGAGVHPYFFRKWNFSFWYHHEALLKTFNLTVEWSPYLSPYLSLRTLFGSLHISIFGQKNLYRFWSKIEIWRDPKIKNYLRKQQKKFGKIFKIEGQVKFLVASIWRKKIWMEIFLKNLYFIISLFIITKQFYIQGVPLIYIQK